MQVRYGAAVAIAAFVVLGGTPAATAVGHVSKPTSARFAPYVDLGDGAPGLLQRAIRTAHLRSFTAAFVLGDGCTPVWDDGADTPVASDAAVTKVISSAQRKGVKVVVSFGGAAPTELALSCPTVKRLTEAYASVITRFALTHVDFDIEGDQVSDHASIVRRFHAIHGLERRDHQLVVSLTVPSAVHGLRAIDDTGVFAMLRQAKSEHVRVDVVNLMTMDYGGRHEMGSAAITAVRAARHQLRRIWPHTGYANLGITPMIGVNDTAIEHFTRADAKRVAAFAKRHHVGRTAFWALGRDKACARPRRKASSSCSGVAQRPLAFTRAFLG